MIYNLNILVHAETNILSKNVYGYLNQFYNSSNFRIDAKTNLAAN